MAKLRDTAVKDNLNIAGSVVAGGKVLSVEGHTHTPANITGLDTYINQKIQAAGGTGGSGTPVVPSGDINAKTLDGHPASDFVLKTESTTTTTAGGTVYSYKKILKFSSIALVITAPDELRNYNISIKMPLYTINIGAKNSVKFTKIPAEWATSLSPTQYFPNYKSVNSTTMEISGIHTFSNSTIIVEVTSNKPITKEIELTSPKYISGYYSNLPVHKSTYTELGYSKFDGSIFFSAEYTIFKPTKIVAKYSDNTLIAYGNCKIFDIDNNIVVRIIGAINIDNPNNIPLKVETFTNNNRSNYQISGLSDNILVVSMDGIVFYIDRVLNTSYTNTQSTPDTSDYKLFTMDNIKKLLGSSNATGGSISATINGVQFDGKTNITTPASKLITPVHINGVEFDGSHDITIPAPTNALTLGGLDSSQYIKATDVGNAAGKIPKFDNDGFLVYPDGSKERIENA